MNPYVITTLLYASGFVVAFIVLFNALKRGFPAIPDEYISTFILGLTLVMVLVAYRVIGFPPLS